MGLGASTSKDDGRLGFHYNTGTRIMTQGSPKFPSSTMPIATVNQLCVPSAIVKSDSLVEQVAQIEDFASGRVDGRAFFQRNYFTQGLDLLVRRGFERLAGESEDAPALVVGAGRRVGVQPRQDSPTLCFENVVRSVAARPQVQKRGRRSRRPS
jgi:hypothetical protein